MSDAESKWVVTQYESGTTVCHLSGAEDRIHPRILVRGCGGETNDDCDRNTHQIAEDVCRMLNGGPPPRWWPDMFRRGPRELAAVDGTLLAAAGPPPEACLDREERYRRQVDLINLMERRGQCPTS